MLAFYCDGEELNRFMSLVLAGNAFDKLQIRSGEIVTRCTFTLDCRLNKDFDAIEGERSFCLWGEVRQNVYDLIKGKRLPKSLRLVFALDDAPLEKLHPNAKAAFINMAYEEGKILFTTGTAQREFSLDKSLDDRWESYVLEVFKRLGVAVRLAE